MRIARNLPPVSQRTVRWAWEDCATQDRHEAVLRAIRVKTILANTGQRVYRVVAKCYVLYKDANTWANLGTSELGRVYYYGDPQTEFGRPGWREGYYWAPWQGWTAPRSLRNTRRDEMDAALVALARYQLTDWTGQ